MVTLFIHHVHYIVVTIPATDLMSVCHYIARLYVVLCCHANYLLHGLVNNVTLLRVIEIETNCQVVQ